MKNILCCGIDEAGRGPVIGPMVMAAAVFDPEGAQKLKELGVKDSKRLSEKRRYHLEPLVKEIARQWEIRVVSAVEIDRGRKAMSLNAMEASYTAELIAGLKPKPGKVIVDATDSISENYKKRIVDFLQKMGKPQPGELVCEHKADDTYPEVSGASIIAKVERDRRIEDLKKEVGDFGSGYPSDERTQRFLKEIIREGRVGDYVRKSWNTVKRGEQKLLGDY